MSSTSYLTATSSSSNFQLIFSTALKAYEKHTKRDLLAHPLASQLQTCDSPASILAVLQAQVDDLSQARKSNERLTKWLNPTINVLLAFSGALGEGVSLVFSPAKVIFAGAGVLLQAAQDVSAAQEALMDIFEQIENFFKRLESYTEVRPSAAMTDIIVKIMVEVLNILGIATKEIKQGRTKKYMKKLLGKTDIEDALKRLDKLTQEEVRMATAQILKISHGIDDTVKGVDDKVKDIGDTVRLVLDDGNETKYILQETARETTALMRLTAKDVGEIKRSQWRQELRKWFSSPDPSTNQIILCRAQHQGTAEWFFRGSFFEEWKSTGSLLWIHGKPGSGKSVLCSALIQDIIKLRDAGQASVAYFYFDFRDTDKQNRRNLLLSLISQLSARSDLCCDILHRVYVTHDNGAHKPTDDVLIQCLKESLASSIDLPIYVIIDALDECPNTFGIPSPRELVLGLVKELVDLSLPHLHICVTSRPEIDIRVVLEPLTSLRVSLHDETGQKKDIVDYIISVVHSDTRMSKWREQDQNLVIETLSERADGMFRWVFCQLESLRHCFPQSLRRSLQGLPKSLDETYERILKDINQATRDYTHRLLQCLTVAVRPLRLEELAEVLAFDFDASGGIPQLNADWRRDDQEHAVLSTCSSLIAVVHDGESRVVQFSHFSVKEFLTSDRLSAAAGDISFHHIDLEPAHTILAQTCLGVLLRLDDSTRESYVQRFPLAGYAAEHWVDHALFEDAHIRLNDGMEKLFDSDRPHFLRWIRVHDMDDDFGEFSDDAKRPDRFAAAPVYYAALCGFPDIVEKLIGEHPEHVNAWGGAWGTALHAASRRNHVKVGQSLLKHGADMNAQGRWQRTPLLITSLWGHLEVGQWLLEQGVDVNAKDDEDWTPIHEATIHGYSELVRMLLRHGADSNAQNIRGHTPLHLASIYGHVNIVRLLLDYGADPAATAYEEDQSTPLHLASYYGNLALAHLLLERGVDIEVEDEKGQTAHEIALREGHHEFAQLLSEHGAEKKM